MSKNDYPPFLFKQIVDEDINSLSNKVQGAEQLEPEAHEKMSRAANFEIEKHWKTKIRPWLNWLGLGIIVVSVLFILVLVGVYVLEIINGGIEEQKKLISLLFEIGKISGATLFVEYLFTKNKK
jgi:hypothetical protein